LKPTKTHGEFTRPMLRSTVNRRIQIESLIQTLIQSTLC